MTELDGAVINQKLDQLMALINQRFQRLEALVTQAQPLPKTQSNRVALALNTTPDTAPDAAPDVTPDAARSQDRLAQLEQQVQQLSQRVQYLEQLLSARGMGRFEIVLEDEDIEDQPDEILWEFMEPGERQ